LIPGQEKQLEKLKEMRLELQKEVCETIEEFGPKLYEDFDDVSVYGLLERHSLTLLLSVEDAATNLERSTVWRHHGHVSQKGPHWNN
jgi:hypothetical protein